MGFEWKVMGLVCEWTRLKSREEFLFLTWILVAFSLCELWMTKYKLGG